MSTTIIYISIKFNSLTLTPTVFIILA
uniref:Uncharacterized protein n=1 Tax=Amphimedon queenslandica TaxID=400682 RepID=A0A1X7UUA4_AMPQE